MTEVTTHVLDLSRGCPAEEVEINVYYVLSESHKEHLTRIKTNGDGRVNQPLVNVEQFRDGEYEFHYSVGPYFRKNQLIFERPHFLEVVVTRVFLSEDVNQYHIPLLISPWGYQVYRGS
ncbi:hydroxyisourate hydrolase [Alkalicoccobacillus porphyridii]|uniref:5-hydroxyisourate hydrolase n=1 Tax=Alkalicoccobacillus porphyridii TaxID=2597270 RepID=A0A554A3R2_9BACI|nr:hydroxyisourate hydrolase [Alkalicoccobacillus porphyridii]TSB48315.1 hydroxyisourate hydrolase [Alkalicoccobacillus porphyridii]